MPPDSTAPDSEATGASRRKIADGPTNNVTSLERAKDLRSRAERRADIPLRQSFVRSNKPGTTPPLARLVNTRGRGGVVALQLYLALVWLISSPPFESRPVRAATWAELLDLPDPAGRGRRRILDALRKLEELKLVTVTRTPGKEVTVNLLHESGDGKPYGQVPSTAYVRAPEAQDRIIYFRLNTKLWTEGHIQTLSAKALAMLLVILEEHYGDYRRRVWWSQETFEERFKLSRSTLSEGTQELCRRNLISIRREFVSPSGSAFAAQKKRNTYRVKGSAVPS